MSKNKIITASFLVLLSLLIGISFLMSERDMETTPDSPTAIPALPTTINTQKKINISGVETNDFLTTPIQSNPGGDVLFSQTAEFQLVYLTQYNKFIIDISSATSEARSAAEKHFLSSLGISEEEACKLDVRVAQQYSLDFPGSENKKLSFCQ